MPIDPGETVIADDVSPGELRAALAALRDRVRYDGGRHVGVTVTDLDRAVRWYGDVLGLEPIGPVVEVRSATGKAGRSRPTSSGPASTASAKRT